MRVTQQSAASLLSQESRNDKRSKLWQHHLCWHLLSCSASTLGGALGTHVHTRCNTNIHPAHVHTHTCERTHACRHAAHAVKAAVCSRPSSLSSLCSTVLPVKGEKKNLCWRPFSPLCRWDTCRYRLAIRKWVFSPLLSLHMLWERCPVTPIRNELDRHASQHMLFCLPWQLSFFLMSTIFTPAYRLPVCALMRKFNRSSKLSYKIFDTKTSWNAVEKSTNKLCLQTQRWRMFLATSWICF